MRRATGVLALLAATTLAITGCSGGASSETGESYTMADPADLIAEAAEEADPEETQYEAYLRKMDEEKAERAAAEAAEESEEESYTESEIEEMVVETAVEEVAEEAAEESQFDDYVLETYTGGSGVGDGYSYGSTLKIGPWVKSSDIETANNIWQSLGGTGSIPFDSFTKNNWSSGVHFGEGTSIMAFGTIAIEDTTQGGFSLADSSKGISVDVFSYELNNATLVDSYVQTSSGSFLHSEKNRGDSILHVYPNMNSRNWGPVPFVICANEALSPQYPDGDPEIMNAIIKFSSNEFTLYPMWVQE